MEYGIPNIFEKVFVQEKQDKRREVEDLRTCDMVIDDVKNIKIS